MANITTSAIMGFCVGDALGVPYEFEFREALKKNPATDMIGEGTHKQPKGTWSDDTSMLLCTAESLTHGLNYHDMVEKFEKWILEGYMTTNGKAFDIGITTRNAISKYMEGDDPTTLGGKGEMDQGNGSLMRILPLAFYLYISGAENIHEEVGRASSITHAHRVPIIACTMYSLYVMALLDGASLWMAYTYVKDEIKKIYSSEEDRETLRVFDRIIENNIALYPEEEIKSSGYVVDTLEAVFWAFLNGDDYKDAVLRAVNLGDDTDTIAALVGALAGIYHGYEDIPSEWLDAIVKKDLVEEVADKFHKSLVDLQN
ncbi:ADP-ribosylglycohydrolase family protein [Clostridium cylindrosporum]|uniref:ADP-ribosylglycohydrolase n=1 Tax=Clostridium cylindrosporum DSM 605 TaxID=1121307 RepID=A0A0J8D9Z6_CLOCY|nr:ADP-ribosylglycohydrolase family protein [Clostridium cylindrosporum]KMT22880.1 ADP-ribosylglycohydrolase [Clostridium cylindrosporum DSM 605]